MLTPDVIASSLLKRASLARPAPLPMKKLLLLSIIVATIAIPARAARQKAPRQALRKAIRNLLVFNLFYLFGVVYLYGRL